jgi:hypothetical protein
MDRSLDQSVSEALSAKGAGPLSFEAMLVLLRAGLDRGLTVSTIDATSDNGWTPRGEWGFHIKSEKLEACAHDPVGRARSAFRDALEFYEGNAHLLDGIEFEVWFWNDEPRSTTA